MAVVIAVRLRTFIVERLSVRIDRVTHYTDSSVAYYWCTAGDPSRWKQFVCNRVHEVQRGSSREEWVHVAGSENVSDFATRGVSSSELAANAAWWAGPAWLAHPEADRPLNRLHSEPEAAATEQVANEMRAVAAAIVVSNPLIDLNRSSSWESAVRVTALVLRFIRRCRRLPDEDPSLLRKAAEHHLIRTEQIAHFAGELRAATNNKKPPRNSPLASFRLKIDDNGLLRAQTRLTLGPHISYEESHPIILPGSSRLATLLILHYHRINAHFGVTTVLAAIRRRYWLTRGRQIIKALLRRCVVCRMAHGPAADQIQAPLPPSRVTLVASFATSGVDFCGPFHTRSREGTAKNYIALFSCTSTRALHLELVPSMSAPQTHLALRRFFAAYPACTRLISDNGRSFCRAATDIKQLFNSIKDPESRELLAARRISWDFNCPAASWHGGFFERIVGIVKQALVKTLGRSLISAEELRTVIAELTAVINDRPISYVENDADAPAALTPAQFIRGGPPATALCSIIPLDRLGPNGLTEVHAPEAATLRAKLLERTNYFRSLSVRWHREYLSLLRSANLDSKGQPRPLRSGDVCLLRDDNAPRIKWNLVRVVASHPGRDGAVRTYTVRFVNGFESRRAAQLLYPLEL